MPPRPISTPPEEVGSAVAALEAATVRVEAAKAELDERLRGDNSAKVSMDETIHHTTLQAMVRQRLKDCLPIPLETLGITVLDSVKLVKRSTLREG